MMRTRREFLRDGIALTALAASAPNFLTRTAFALAETGTASAQQHARILVVIQLSGGNDGLNTVVPFADDAYYQARPTLGVPAAQVLKLNDHVGLHPALAGLRPLFDAGHLAVLQGIGYPNPDRSHFRSMDIWQSGVSDDYAASGWLGRYFETTHDPKNAAATSPTLALSIGQTLEPALVGEAPVGIAMRDPEQLYRLTRFHARSQVAADQPPGAADTPLDFLRRTALNATVAADRIRNAAATGHPSDAYPKDALGRDLRQVAGLIAGGLDTRIYYLTLGGFDTHANQPQAHEKLLQTLGDSIKAFQDDLARLGVADRVVGFTFSEFGRRLHENGSRGTDHGKAAPLFAFGAPLKGGVIGKHPSLTDLSEGDPRYHTDFRRLYATMLKHWLGADPAPILLGQFEPLPLFA